MPWRDFPGAAVMPGRGWLEKLPVGRKIDGDLLASSFRVVMFLTVVKLASRNFLNN